MKQKNQIVETKVIKTDWQLRVVGGGVGLIKMSLAINNDQKENKLFVVLIAGAKLQ